MIRLLEVQKSTTDIEVSMTPEIRTYNIVSGLMSDNCQPYRVAERIMIWLTPTGLLGELEAIYPPTVNKFPCQYEKELRKQDGFPRFEVITCNGEGIIQPLDDGFIVWLRKERTVDLLIEFKQVQFLFEQDELVAIVTHRVSIVE